MEKNRKYFWFVNNPEYHYRKMGLLSVSFGRFLTNFLTVGRLASAGKKRSILSDCAHIHKTIVKVFVQRDFYCNRRAAMVAGMAHCHVLEFRYTDKNILDKSY